jgi:hypothetical protein
MLDSSKEAHMRNWAAGIGVLLVAGLVWASAAGCNKTKAEQGAALLLEMVDVNQGAVEDIIDLVDDNYDLCVKGLREVTDLQKSTRATMQTLVNQWNQFKKGSTAKDMMDAVEQAKPKIEQMLNDVDEIQEGAYKIFERFQKNCPNETPKVFKIMQDTGVIMMSLMSNDLVG